MRWSEPTACTQNQGRDPRDLLPAGWTRGAHARHPPTGPTELPRGSQWSYEVKWDGVRALADTTTGVLRLWSRQEREITVAYPELAGLAAIDDVILDGEIVLLADGIPSFTALAERMHVRDSRRAAALAARQPVTFMVFDVVRTDGVDVTGSTYDERRALLERLTLPENVQRSPVYPDGQDLWGVTRQLGLEGVVAKKRTSMYHPGRRSEEWVKAPHRRTRAALVCGWRVETNGSGRLGAVLFGARDANGALRFLGRAGSGLSGPKAARMRELLVEHARTDSPFDEEVPALDARGTHWVDPVVVVDTLYLARNPTGRLRQPVVRGVRTDTDADPWEQP
ncbi:non-homologous end-joining DNA ligase [Cellulomonas sp. URHD0024]|uniref:non-homologous end-joining DNA ligase n=1 Tax=Cellulomonas sp. URHD0024 TaxID=1302620 RepID=UPI00040A3D20